MPAKTAATLALVDDHVLLRKGFASLIGGLDDAYEILFEAGDFRQMQDKINKDNLPDIILLDIDMPEGESYACIRWLRKFFPAVKILAIGFFDDDKTVGHLLQSGADGGLNKTADLQKLKDALRTMMKKGFYYADFINTKYKLNAR